MTGTNKKMNPILKEILSWILLVAAALFISTLINSQVLSLATVKEVSMQDTLYENQTLVINRLAYRNRQPRTGDIIVFYDINEDRQLIKRLIAVEGDQVEIKDGKVFVNGEELKEDYIKDGYTPQGVNPEYSNLVVPKGYVYVLGDNRKNSRDSRSIGPIEVERITGKAIFRFYPFNKIRTF